jgi:ribulose-phosphate 3-epimerase
MVRRAQTIVAASLLSANFANMEQGIRLAESAGADWLHLDVMDGAFVPNLTFGPKMVKDVKTVSHLPLDVHLMTERPEHLVPMFIDAGADHITFHIEATIHIHRLLMSIREAGRKCGVSLVPSTPVSALSEILPLCNIVLVMTVNPGFGGQTLIGQCLKKIEQLSEIRSRMHYGYLIAVDGGINRDTVKFVRDAGTDVLISGSAFFASSNPSEEIQIFRGTIFV